MACPRSARGRSRDCLLGKQEGDPFRRTPMERRRAGGDPLRICPRDPLYAMEEGSRRGRSMACETSRKIAKIIYFRSEELDPVPKPTWTKTGPAIRAALGSGLLVLSKEESSELNAARDL